MQLVILYLLLHKSSGKKGEMLKSNEFKYF